MCPQPRTLLFKGIMKKVQVVTEIMNIVDQWLPSVRFQEKILYTEY